MHCSADRGEKKIVGGAGNNDKAYASFLKTPTLVKFGHFLKA